MCDACKIAEKVLLALAAETARRGYNLKATTPPPNADRARIERALERALGSELKEQQAAILKLLGDPPIAGNLSDAFWALWDGRIVSALQPVLIEIYAERAAQMGRSLGIGLDWDLINQNAAAWAKEYTFDLVKGIEGTTKDLLQNSIESFYANGLTREALEDLIGRGFSADRASTIAVTEATRASSQGEVAVRQNLAQYGIETRPYWATNNDELVCPVCGPLNNKPAAGQDITGQPYWINPKTKEQMQPPPAHPNCRCWVNLRL